MQRAIAELEGKLDTYVSRADSAQHLSRSIETEKSELLAAYRAAQQQLAVIFTCVFNSVLISFVALR